MTNALLIGLSVGMLAALLLRWRFGPRPSWAEKLLDLLGRPGHPIVANLPAAGPPLCGMCLGLVATAAGDPWFEVAIGAALALALVTAWFATDPPAFAKPPWLRELDGTGAFAPRPTSYLEYLFSVQLVLVLCCALAIGLLWLIQ